mmetsp:Transcript_7403/g.16774  ORF Transcript_7403/g.16774 Transcript_7403/m.16774 type:complete len:227 (+) Transcript_7403:1376-2056(+)
MDVAVPARLRPTWSGSLEKEVPTCSIGLLSDGRAGRSSRGSGKFNVVLPTLSLLSSDSRDDERRGRLVDLSSACSAGGTVMSKAASLPEALPAVHLEHKRINPSNSCESSSWTCMPYSSNACSSRASAAAAAGVSGPQSRISPRPSAQGAQGSRGAFWAGAHTPQPGIHHDRNDSCVSFSFSAGSSGTGDGGPPTTEKVGGISIVLLFSAAKAFWSEAIRRCSSST